MKIIKLKHGSIQRKPANQWIHWLACSVVALSTATLIACGSSQAEKSAPPVDPGNAEPRAEEQQTTERGQFVDSAVSGLFYETNSGEGFTDHDGYFDYQENEAIGFYIGNIALGFAPAAEILTPTDITGSEDGISDAAINVLRLLQTLDEDGDPSNGISISANTHRVASQIPEGAINVFTDSQEFAQNETLLSLIGQVTNVSGLVATENAVSHFRATQQQLAR